MHSSIGKLYFAIRYSIGKVSQVIGTQLLSVNMNIKFMKDTKFLSHRGKTLWKNLDMSKALMKTKPSKILGRQLYIVLNFDINFPMMIILVGPLIHLVLGQRLI